MQDNDKNKLREISFQELYENIRHISERRHIFLNYFMVIFMAYLAGFFQIILHCKNSSSPPICLNNLIEVINQIQPGHRQIMGIASFFIALIGVIFLLACIRHIKMIENFRKSLYRLANKEEPQKKWEITEGKLERTLHILITLALTILGSIFFSQRWWIIITIGLISIFLFLFFVFIKKKLAPPEDFLAPCTKTLLK